MSAVATASQKLWRYALSLNCPKKRALPLARTALMVEFLLHVPLRMANLAELTFDQHISWPAGCKGQAWLLIPGVKTKTGEPYEAELSGELLAMLRTYRDKILPKLSGRRRDEIFVAVNGRRKRAETISDLFNETTLAHLGFKVTPHQMRHIAAKLILDPNPGAFELVKQLLGHKSLKTTIAFYAGLDTSRAVATTILSFRRSVPSVSASEGGADRCASRQAADERTTQAPAVARLARRGSLSP
jgi:integrase